MAKPKDYVEESGVGFWFLGTLTWEKRVVEVALADLARLLPEPGRRCHTVLDAGCGQGKALKPLQQHFQAERIIGVDVDGRALEAACREAMRHGLVAELIEADCASIPLPDASVDLVFCHQTLHHLVRQEETLAEFRRLLKPGGVLLLAESTKAYIHSWVIRLLFRHPMHVQRTAPEYLELVRKAGFEFGSADVSYPYLWWSRARDFGLLERWHIKSPPPVGQREETLVNLVATKPR
ncbi:MAG TPA: class I SAM-dependent methyltransferase [Gammaproteobacteria bacterium]|nr:class I SAM-dependent methyltransferase [Gammaproteobacteria bacterium]